MKCEHYKEQFAHWLNNELPPVDRVAFETHLSRCADCKQEFQAYEEMWKLMGNMPVEESSGNMPVRFNAMLDTFRKIEAEKKNSVGNLFARIRQTWTTQPGFQLAYTIVIAVTGIAAGYLFSQKGTTDKTNTQQIASLTAQVQEMRQLMMLTLLENPSASERIRAVNYTNEIRKVNKPVAQALLTTLNNDPNVNVRLQTLEALANFANDPHIREGLVQSIIRQESPLVQSAMADIMVRLQEKRSIEPFKKLLQQKDLNVLVRTKIEESIGQII